MTQRTYEVGRRARNAGFTLPFRLRRLVGFFAAAAWTVPVGLYIEGIESSGPGDALHGTAVRWGAIAAILAGLLYWGLGQVVDRVQKQNGSFFLLSAVVGEDRVQDRWVRALHRAGGLRGDTTHPFTETGVVRRRLSDEASAAARDVRTFLIDYQYALRQDDPATSTNVLSNLAWPAAMALGVSGQVSNATIWYLRPAPGSDWAKSYDQPWWRPFRPRWLSGELLDVLPAEFGPDLAADVDISSTDRPEPACGESVVVRLALSRSFDEGSTNDLVADIGPAKIWTLDAATDGLSANELEQRSFDPARFIEDTERCAAMIYEALATGHPVHVIAALPTPVALGVGVLLSRWGDDETLCFTPHNYSHSSKRFEAWPINPSLAISTQQSLTKRIVNLTEHPVTLVVTGQAPVTFAPSGHVARVNEQLGEPATTSGPDGTQLPLVSVRYGSVVDLPAPAPGTLYLVSRVTAAAARGRRDLVFPHDEVREGGRIVGCRMLGRFGQ